MFNKEDIIVVRTSCDYYDEYGGLDYKVDRVDSSVIYCYPQSGSRTSQIHGFNENDVELKIPYNFIEKIIKDLEILEKRCLIKEI